jgi:hypothetical protein
MNARLFINFILAANGGACRNRLWPPFAKARSRAQLPEAPRLERPLYRKAIIASVWLLISVLTRRAVVFHDGDFWSRDLEQGGR